MSIKGKPFYTISEDLIFIEQYLYIQQLRFENRLTCLVDIDTDIQQYYIPKLILQPIVENSILHGISEITSKGIVAITAEKNGNDILIYVRDNGPGFKKSFSEDLKGKNSKSSYGLDNIDKRLKLYFGASYGLSFRNNNENGACTIIRMPAVNQLSDLESINENTFDR